MKEVCKINEDNKDYLRQFICDDLGKFGVFLLNILLFCYLTGLTFIYLIERSCTDCYFLRMVQDRCHSPSFQLFTTNLPSPNITKEVSPSDILSFLAPQEENGGWKARQLRLTQ